MGPESSDWWDYFSMVKKLTKRLFQKILLYSEIAAPAFTEFLSDKVFCSTSKILDGDVL